jgi:hypothetical protein
MMLTPVCWLFMKFAVRRCGLGSCGVVLPKKFSSSMAASPVCASLLPIMPNL